MTLWWLSFADGERPKGQQFLGVALVEAGSLPQALMMAHALGCNPGGEVASVEVPLEVVPLVPAEYRNRLLTRDETENLNAMFR